MSRVGFDVSGTVKDVLYCSSRGGSQGGPPRGSRGPPGAGGQSGSYYFRLLQNLDLQS